MSPKALIALAVIAGGAAYLLSRSSAAAAACEPTATKPSKLPPAGGYIVVAEVWDPVACHYVDNVQEIPIDQAGIDIAKSNIGKAGKDGEVPPGLVGYARIYDDKGAIVLAVKRASGGVFEQI